MKSLLKTALVIASLFAMHAPAGATTLSDYFPSHDKLLSDVRSKVESPRFIRQFSLDHFVDAKGHKVPLKLVGSDVRRKPYQVRVDLTNFVGATSIVQTYRGGGKTLNSCLIVGYVMHFEKVAGEALWLKKFYAVNRISGGKTPCEASLDTNERAKIFFADNTGTIDKSMDRLLNRR
jgi:hypothetical protein